MKTNKIYLNRLLLLFFMALITLSPEAQSTELLIFVSASGNDAIRKIGFKEFDYSQAGVYGSDEWKKLASFDPAVARKFDETINRNEKKDSIMFVYFFILREKI